MFYQPKSKIRYTLAILKCDIQIVLCLHKSTTYLCQEGGRQQL